MSLSIVSLETLSFSRTSVKKIFSKRLSRSYSNKKEFQFDESKLEKVAYLYLNTLKKANIEKLSPKLLVDEKSFDDRFLSPELHTSLSCAFVHPISYQKYGIVMDWTDLDTLDHLIKLKKPLISTNGKEAFEAQLSHQIPFIEKMQALVTSINIKQAIMRYKLFITLLKESNSNLCPPLDVDIIWHSHMLQHQEYVKSTIDYFGQVLDHDDMPLSEEKTKDRLQKSKILWDNRFGQSDLEGTHYTIPLQFTHTKHEKKSCNDDLSQIINLTTVNISTTKSDSFSSCSSGCGGGSCSSGCGGGCGGCSA